MGWELGVGTLGVRAMPTRAGGGPAERGLGTLVAEMLDMSWQLWGPWQGAGTSWALRSLPTQPFRDFPSSLMFPWWWALVCAGQSFPTLPPKPHPAAATQAGTPPWWPRGSLRGWVLGALGTPGHPARPPSATCWAVRVGAQGWSSPSSSSAVTGHGPTVRMRPGRVTSGSRAAETPSVWGWALTHGFSSTPSSIPLQGFPGFSLPSASLGSFQGRHLCHEGKLEHGSPRCGQAGCSGFAQGMLRVCSGFAQGMLRLSSRTAELPPRATNPQSLCEPWGLV